MLITSTAHSWVLQDSSVSVSWYSNMLIYTLDAVMFSDIDKEYKE